MSILTDKLASGAVSTAGAATVVYTCPADHHVRLRRSTIQATNAGGALLYYLTDTGGHVVSLLNVAGAVVGVPQNDSGDHVLEEGDTLSILAASGTGCRYWLSGTLYTDP